MRLILRKPRFSEAIEKMAHVTGVGNRYVFPDKCDCNPWVAFIHLLENAAGFLQTIKMSQICGYHGGGWSAAIGELVAWWKS